MTSATIQNPEFVKRIVVDAENTVPLRKKFLDGKELTAAELKKLLATTPRHKEITWGPDRITMIPWTALEHLQVAIKDTVKRKVKGDFVETGAWRGGTCIVAKSVYESLGAKTKIYVCDSFEGLPKPDVEKYPDDKGDTHYADPNMAASLDTVKKNFKLFGLLDDRIIFVKGWFSNTMPKAPFKDISILRLDGDMYESTIDVLHNVYHKLSIGGYCIIDDYLHPACKAAIEDFRRHHGITETIQKVDKKDPLNEVHYWIKTKPTTFREIENYSKRGIARVADTFKNRGLRRVRRGVGSVVDSFRKRGK